VIPRSARLVAYDTETWRIAPGRLAPPLVCASFAWRGEDGRISSTLCDRSTGVEVFRQLLAEGCTVAAHNASFDNAVMIAADRSLEPLVWRAYDEGRLVCTKIREQLLAVAEGRANRFTPHSSLAACVKRYFAEVVTGKGADAWRLRYHQLDGVPIDDWPDEARRYAEHDAVYCLRVYDAQTTAIGDIAGLDTIPDEACQTRAAWALHLSSVWGLRADADRVADYAEELHSRVARAEPTLAAAGLLVDGVIKKAATQALVVEAYQRYDLGEVELTKKGLELEKNGADREELIPHYVACGGDVLREVPCRDGDCGEVPCGEVLHVLVDREDAARERSKYLEHLDRGTREVLNPFVDPVKATGRCSVGSPPYQQFPRRAGARECIIPRPGRVFFGADYSSAELVTLAQVLVETVGYSALAETLRAGIDPHLRTGADILGIPLEEAISRKGDPDVKDARQLAKALNFGLPGGLGPATFVDYAWGSWGIRITKSRARQLKERWLALYPEVRDYFAIVSQRCDTGGGRFDLVQPYSGRLRGAVGYCDGCNSPFQGLAADAAKAALYRVQREGWLEIGPLAGSRAVLFVHDEIICETDEAGAAEAAERLVEIMVEELALRCPDVASAADAEPWIARRWSKATKSVRDSAGRLIVWEDC